MRGDHIRASRHLLIDVLQHGRRSRNVASACEQNDERCSGPANPRRRAKPSRDIVCNFKLRERFFPVAEIERSDADNAPRAALPLKMLELLGYHERFARKAKGTRVLTAPRQAIRKDVSCERFAGAPADFERGLHNPLIHELLSRERAPTGGPRRCVVTRPGDQ